jgi:Concanavalin A-like lectin/glucanases superfamily
MKRRGTTTDGKRDNGGPGVTRTALTAGSVCVALVSACSFGIDLNGFFGGVVPSPADGGDAAVEVDGGLVVRDAGPEVADGVDANVNEPEGGLSYSARVLADAPVAYWRLGDKTGSIARDEKGQYAGVIKGTVFRDQPGVVDGNGAMRFDGSTGYIDFGDVLDFPNRKPFSIEAWVKPEVIDTNVRPYISKISVEDPFDGYSVILFQPRGIHFALCAQETDCPSPRAPAPPINRFTHLVVTYDGSLAQIFYDGARVKSGPYSGALIDNDIALTIGRDSAGQSFAGTLDEVAIYDRALPEARIQAHFAAVPQ